MPQDNDRQARFNAMLEVMTPRQIEIAGHMADSGSRSLIIPQKLLAPYQLLIAARVLKDPRMTSLAQQEYADMAKKHYPGDGALPRLKAGKADAPLFGEMGALLDYIDEGIADIEAALPPPAVETPAERPSKLGRPHHRGPRKARG